MCRCVCLPWGTSLSKSESSSISHRFVSGLSRSFSLTYFVKQTESKILRLVNDQKAKL